LITVDAGGSQRSLKKIEIQAALTVIGGGLAGVCCAITAAREGLKVALVQDRPVLGGNASSEVRLWALGATSHQGNNNRWAREGGVIDEIMVKNTWRNKEGNPILFDALLLEMVRAEENITLLLNTAMISASMTDDARIQSVRAFNSQNSTLYEIESPLFCDASGDGILGYLAGAAFRMGAESADEFNEPFAPDTSYGELLGHSIFFYTKDTGKPVTYVPPDFALKDIEQLPRHQHINAKSVGCSLWWLEYGGRLDTVHDTEEIKWELWKVAYGVWHYLKNSGKFPETENHTLEWIGAIPGKRESRRFEGDYMLRQSDIVGQRRHDDAVSFGGWAIDLHPADGVYSDKPGCTQYHSKGIYQIPWRCMYSRNVENLFLTGRLISVSHVAFGSTRVMMTAAHNGQAVGMAAAICTASNLSPRDLTEPPRMKALQTRLMRAGQFIPHLQLEDPLDLVQHAHITASSEYELARLAPSGETLPLNSARAMLIPSSAGTFPEVTFYFSAEKRQQIEVQLRASDREGNFTPDKILTTKTVMVEPGSGVPTPVFFDVHIDNPQYLFICVMPCEGVSIAQSATMLTGVMSLVHSANKKVASDAVQTPPEGSGFDKFEFWLPERRPGGKLLAAEFNPSIKAFGAEQLRTGYNRPFIQSNAWVAKKDDVCPSLTLTWNAKQTIRTIQLHFDVDYDHAMESVQFGHHDSAMPYCVRAFRILDDRGRVLHNESDNHQGLYTIQLDDAVQTSVLRIEILETRVAPAALFSVRCYESG
jgi:hypothetical protein